MRAFGTLAIENGSPAAHQFTVFASLATVEHRTTLCHSRNIYAVENKASCWHYLLVFIINLYYYLSITVIVFLCCYYYYINIYYIVPQAQYLRRRK